jgi:hypothetical protein
MSVDYPWKGKTQGFAEKKSTKCVFSDRSVRNGEALSGVSQNNMTVTKDRTEGYS